MKEILSVDLTPQGYRHSLALPPNFSTEKLQRVKQAFVNVWDKPPRPGVRFGNTFDRPEKDRYIATLDAIFKKESMITMQQDLFYSLLPLLEDKQFHNKFAYHVASAALPEYTGQPKRNVIDRIGVELEGGWREYHEYMKGDGSVSGLRHSNHTGEIAFPPFPPDRFPWVEPISLPRFQNIREGTMGSFTSMYPQYVNHTCGMHVHISFPSRGMYAAFVDARFTPWLIRGLKRWGEIGGIKSTAFYSRLEGNQQFCRNIYSPETQLVNGGDRYAIVNYCYNRYQTIEIRVLPMFKDVRFAIKAIRALVKLVNLWGCEFGPADGPLRLSSFTTEEVIPVEKKPKAKRAPKAKAMDIPAPAPSKATGPLISPLSFAVGQEVVISERVLELRRTPDDHYLTVIRPYIGQRCVVHEVHSNLITFRWNDGRNSWSLPPQYLDAATAAPHLACSDPDCRLCEVSHEEQRRLAAAERIHLL